MPPRRFVDEKTSDSAEGHEYHRRKDQNLILQPAVRDSLETPNPTEAGDAQSGTHRHGVPRRQEAADFLRGNLDDAYRGDGAEWADSHARNDSGPDHALMLREKHAAVCQIIRNRVRGGRPTAGR